ncbi:MAG TPA: undecaprenyl-diphosphate phosphatase [Solirubrobacteraceae bacterium]|jgi:undecaprenyl-diphosphatase|nr:undecaprenyl-diphosphate phosphatase [Solirubrobacteraceae bacterium]
MRPARALALGLLHGPAELLPVSSSAHAALVLQDLAPDRRKELEVALHAGTLAALGPPRVAPWLVLATAPPALAGFLLEGPIERRLGTPPTLAAGLLVGALALAAADRAPQRRRLAAPSPRDALWLGAAQAAALVPGVSRHGAALSVLRARGFAREAAHELSREAARPVLAGAATLKGWRVVRRVAASGTEGGELPALLAAAAGSALSTRLAARALGGRGVRAPLWPFALYRAGLAAAVVATARRAQPRRT